MTTRFICGLLTTAILSCQTRKEFVYAVKASHDEQLNIFSDSGDFLAEVNKLKQLALPKHSHLYQSPTKAELHKFTLLAQALIIQDLNTALKHAKALEYELFEFVDTNSQIRLYGLREQEKHQLRGWGSYFMNPKFSTTALVEVPHILFDQYTEEIGAKAFLNSGAYGFLLAGAHRNANGTGTADVCNPIPSIFHAVHKAWVVSKFKTWQIHGFSLEARRNYPRNTQTVLSDGQGKLTAEIIDLKQRFNQHKFVSYAYKKHSVSRLVNNNLNRGAVGTMFSDLAGTHNIQGIYSRQVGAAFIHIELEKQIRTSSTARDTIANEIADSIQSMC